MLPADAPLKGHQRPRIFSAPPAYSYETGREAVELAAMAGLFLDDWQQFVLTQSLAEDERGRFVAFETGIVVPRQNGKGSLFEARELAGLFLLDEQLLIHSAHLFSTSLDAFRRILMLIESTPDFDRQVMRVAKSHGEEGIELKSGQRLLFKTRTKGGGRGLTGDFVGLDEAMILPSATVGALMPTMAARSMLGNPQLWYAGSAGLADSEVLGRIRRRALAGGDPSLCYVEWSVDEAKYKRPEDAKVLSADPVEWAQANPGLGIRISQGYIEDEHRSLDSVEFARERLSIGQWPLDEEAAKVIPLVWWQACRDVTSSAVSQVAFGVDMTLDRARTSIGVAGARSDGRRHVEVTDNRAGSDWVVARCVDLQRKWRPVGFVVDPGGPAGSLIADLEAAGVVVIKVTARELAQASAGLHDDVRDNLLRHMDDYRLNDAVSGAAKRTLSDAWAFARDTDVDSSPLLAVTLARHGHTDAVRPPSVYEERGMVVL